MTEDGILDLVYQAHRRLGDLEKLPRDYGTGELLYSSDVHTVEAVARRPGCSLTQLAGSLGVSKPAASKFARKLLRLGYLVKEMQANNAKEVSFSLTVKGRRVEQAHRRFTQRVFGPLRAIESGLSAPDRQVIRRFLAAIVEASSW